MSKLYSTSGPWRDAAQAEGLTAAKAKAARLAVGGDLRSILLWADDPAQSGVDEAGVRAAWESLRPLDDGQVRMIMRAVSILNDGLFVP